MSQSINSQPGRPQVDKCTQKKSYIPSEISYKTPSYQDVDVNTMQDFFVLVSDKREETSVFMIAALSSSPSLS